MNNATNRRPGAKGTRILYLDSYTRPSSESKASDEIGYGITAGSVIKAHLQRLGYSVHDLSMLGLKSESKLSWVRDSYALLQTLPLESYDVIFIFHIFHQFPSEVRRIILERGFRHIKIVGYTLGSHWDKTDTFRTTFYPGMEVADLANLMCLDRVLIVSEYFRKLLIESIRQFSAAAADILEPHLVVTGLPIDDALIDQYQNDSKQERVQIIFNHSPTEGKNPGTFFRVMEQILAKYPVSLLMTRSFYSDSPGYEQLQHLCRSFPNQIVLGNTLPLPEYYTSLWASSIQVSTALHESFGIGTLEAMYTKNCCFLPNRLSYPEITDGLGLYSEEEELCEMIGSYILDSTARDRMGNLMRKQSLRYLPKAVVERISAAIQSALSE